MIKEKVYVKVDSTFDPTGFMQPTSITWSDGRTLTVRRITIAANRVVKDEGFFQVDLFTDTTKLEKEKKLQNAMLGLKKKFGKNAVLKGTNYLDGATMRERNKTIGGHKAE